MVCKGCSSARTLASNGFEVEQCDFRVLRGLRKNSIDFSAQKKLPEESAGTGAAEAES